jgi:hypothetical protein
MQTKVLEITLLVVYSEWDDALGGEAVLNTKEDIANSASLEVVQRILENIPNGKACSLVMGHKNLDNAEAGLRYGL